RSAPDRGAKRRAGKADLSHRDDARQNRRQWRVRRARSGSVGYDGALVKRGSVMRQISAARLVAALIAGAAIVSVSAHQPPAGGGIAAAPWFLASPQPTPFGNLLPKKDDAQKKQREALAAAAVKRIIATPVAPTTAQPTVVCGMTVIPADPQFDAGIRRTPPANGQTFTMQSIVPKDCQIR